MSTHLLTGKYGYRHALEPVSSLRTWSFEIQEPLDIAADSPVVVRHLGILAARYFHKPLKPGYTAAFITAKTTLAVAIVHSLPPDD